MRNILLISNQSTIQSTEAKWMMTAGKNLKKHFITVK